MKEFRFGGFWWDLDLGWVLNHGVLEGGVFWSTKGQQRHLLDLSLVICLLIYIYIVFTCVYYVFILLYIYVCLCQSICELTGM